MAVWSLLSSAPLSTPGTAWKRVEAQQLTLDWTTGDDLNTARTLAVTFANAGNQQGIVLALRLINLSSGTLTIKLQHYNGSTWDDTTTDTFTVDATNFPGFGGSYLVKYFPLTSAAVNTSASTWRYSLSCNVSGRLGWVRTSTAGQYFYAAVLDASAAGPSTGDTVIINNAQTLTFDQTFTLGATNGTAIVIGYGATFAWENAPAAAYTLTLQGKVVWGTSGAFLVGSEASPIPVAERATIDLTGYTGGSTLFLSPNYYTGTPALFANKIDIWGAEDSSIATRLSAEGAAGQRVVVTADDMSAIWANGDAVYLFGKARGVADNVSYTISSMSGTSITLNANLDFKALEGAGLVNLNRKNNLGVWITTGSNGAGLCYAAQCRIDYLKVVGAYVENLGLGVGVPSHNSANSLIRTVLWYSTAQTSPMNVYTAASSLGPLTLNGLYAIETSAQYAVGVLLPLPPQSSVSNLFVKNFYASTGGLGLTGNNCTFTNVIGCHCDAGSTYFTAVLQGNGNTYTNCFFVGGYSALNLTCNACTFTGVRVNFGSSYCLYLNSNVANTFNTCYIGSQADGATKTIWVVSNSYVDCNFLDCAFGAAGIGNLANSCQGSKLKVYTASAHKTYSTYGDYELQAAVYATLKRACKMTPSSATSPLRVPTTVRGYAGQVLTVPVKLRKNAAYGSANRPYITLSGLGMTPDTAAMPDTDDTWETVSVSGTPTASGDADIEIGCYLGGAGSLAYYDDLKPTIAPFSTGTSEIWYRGEPSKFTVTTVVTAQGDWTDDPYVVANEATALAYTGIALDAGALTLAITEAHSIVELYEYIKAKCRDDEIPNIYLTTVDGVNWQTNCDVTVNGVALSGTGALNLGTQSLSLPSGGSTTLRVENGTLILDTPGTINTLLGTCTIDYQATGTYDHRAVTPTGTITLDTTNDSTVTAQLKPGTDYVNADPTNITVESSTSVTVSITNLIVGSQVRVTKVSDGSELLNVTADDTTESFNFTYTVDTAIAIRVRKASAATKYLEWSGGGTIGATGLSVQVSQVEDSNIEASSPAATGWSVDYGTKVITAGSAALTTGELYTWLMDQMDASGNMQYLNPMTCEVKDASYTLRNGYTLVADAEQKLSTGGILTSDGATIYTNVYTVGSIIAGSNVIVKQNGAKISPWWSAGHIDVLVKVKDGTLIDSGNLYFYLRKFNNPYEYVSLDASAGGRQVVAVANSADTNNATAEGTVSTWNDISITWGAVNKDLGDGGGSCPYDCVVDGAARTVAQIYEYLKYVLRDGETAHQNGVDGELYLSANPATYALLKTAPFGTMAGGKLFGARGIWLENMASADALNYQLTDGNGVTHDPPTPPVYLSVMGIVAGSRIQLYDTDTSTELANEIVAGTSYQFEYTYPGTDHTIRVRLAMADGAGIGYIFNETNQVATTSGFNMIAAQVADPVYVANNIDGSLVTEFSVTGTTVKCFVDDPDNSTTVQRGYNWFQWMLSTESGIRDQSNYWRATDTTNYLFYSSLQIQNLSADPLLLAGGYFVPSTGGSPIDCYDTTGGPIFMGYPHVVGVGSGLTAEEHTLLEGRAAPGDQMTLTAAYDAAKSAAPAGAAMTLTSAYDAAKSAAPAGAAMTLTGAYEAAKSAAPAGAAMTLTADERNATALAHLTYANGIETGWTPQMAMRVVFAILAGKLSGAPDNDVSVWSAIGHKVRAIFEHDSNGNRTDVTLDGED